MIKYTYNIWNAVNNSTQVLSASTLPKFCWSINWCGSLLPGRNKIKYIHVLQTCKSAIGFRCPLTSIYFLLFLFSNKHRTSKYLFCAIQSSTSNAFFLNIFINARDNGVFWIGSLINIVNPDPIEDYMNGVPIIVSDKQAILVLRNNHSPIPICNNLEKDLSNVFHPTQ